jgi:hypothetical protein
MLYTRYIKIRIFQSRYILIMMDHYGFSRGIICISGKYIPSILLRGHCRPIFIRWTANNLQNGQSEVLRIQIGKKNSDTDFYFILDLHEGFVSFSRSHSSMSDIHLFKTRYLNFFLFVRQFGSGFTGEIEFGSEKRLSLSIKKSTCVKMLVTLCGSAITNVFPVSMKRLEEK